MSSLEGERDGRDDSSFTKSNDPVSFDGMELGYVVRFCGALVPTDACVGSLWGSRVLAITPAIAPANRSSSGSR